MFYFIPFKGKCLNIGLMDANEALSMTKTKNKVFQYHHIKLLGFVHAIIGCSVTKQPVKGQYWNREWKNVLKNINF